MYRYPYFLRRVAVVHAVVLACTFSPTNAFAVPDERDPLGEGEGELPEILRAPPPLEGPPEVIEGEVLSARPLAREREARLGVRFDEGYAEVSVTSVVENVARYETPVALTFRTPVCTVLRASCGTGCVATATVTETAVRVTTAPALAANGTRTVSLVYATPTTRVAGNVRVSLPPRGGDNRITRFRLSATGDAPIMLGDAPIDAAGVELSPFSTVRLSTRPGLPRLRATRTMTARGLRVDVHAGDEALGALRIAVLVDGSPSTLGPARNAIAEALTALVARLPAESEIRIVRFGTRPELVVAPTRVADVTASVLTATVGDAQGNTTRLDRALSSVELGDVDRFVVLGDGGMTRTRDDETEAALRRRPTTYVLFGAREPSEALNAEVALGRLELIDARAEGEHAVTTHDDGPLGDALESALSPRAPVVLRDGRRVVFTGRLARGQTLVFTGALRRPSLSVSGRRIALEAVSEPVLASLPIHRRTLSDAPRVRGRDLPRETILEALRRQFIPPARQCLRADRRGRARYAVRTALVLRLADREVTAIDVEGDLPAPLRTCLAEALAALVLPAAWAPMIVRYPIHTLEADVPPTLELDEETAGALERTLGETDDER
jgi:hypothetical protein